MGNRGGRWERTPFRGNLDAQRIPSLQIYVLVSQSEPPVEVYRRVC